MYEIHEARTVDDAERLRPYWDVLPWQREEAELDFLLARVRARPGASPFGVILTRDGVPVAGVAGRLERRPLATSLGYRTIYAPPARVLQIVDGGIASSEQAALATLTGTLDTWLRRGHADALAVPALSTGSPELAAFAEIGGRLRQQALIRPWPRRRLPLPDSFDAFLAGRSRKTRFGVRYDAKKLLEAHGDQLSVAVLDGPDDVERLIRDLEAVAASAYQRALGGGFDAAGDQRALAGLALARGWWRAYVLNIDGRPVAYWLCSTYRGTMLLRTTGYDPAFRKHRVGIYLLMRVIEHACADPTLHVLDFGPGDDAYKRHFSDVGTEERNLLIYAPTARAIGINATRTAILGTQRVARSALDRARLTDRLRTEWRNRLRKSRP